MSELTRKEFVQSSINTRKEQLDAGNLSLSDRNKIEGEIAEFEREKLDIEAAEKEQKENEDARKLVVQEASDRAAYILDNLIIEGLTMRELCAGENEYQLLRIAVQSEYIAQAEAASAEKQLLVLQQKEADRAAADRELQLQRQNDELQKTVADIKEHNSEIASDNAKLRNQVFELNKDKEDAESKRDAAMAKVEGLELLVSEKQEQIDILRKEASIGAKAAIHTIDQSEQVKAIADQIKASRIHVYDVVPDDVINPRNYTAKRADTGEEVTYNWTSKNKFIELKNEDEVSQFRAQHAQESAFPDLTLANPVSFEIDTPRIITDEQFRSSLECVQEGTEVPQENTGAGDISGDAQGVAPTAVSREEFEALKADVEVLKRRNGMVA